MGYTSIFLKTKKVTLTLLAMLFATAFYAQETMQPMKASTINNLLHDENKAANIKIGSDVPDFTLTNTEGKTTTLRSFSGKYLLIYHYGLCPGALTLDPYIVELYTKHSDSLEVVGYNNNREQIEELVAIYKEIEGGSIEIAGLDMDVDKALESMTNHPWKWDVDVTGKNTELIDFFNIKGMPYFVFISPNGKLLAHGFGEVFLDIVKPHFEKK